MSPPHDDWRPPTGRPRQTAITVAPEAITAAKEIADRSSRNAAVVRALADGRYQAEMATLRALVRTHDDIAIRSARLSEYLEAS